MQSMMGPAPQSRRRWQHKIAGVRCSFRLHNGFYKGAHLSDAGDGPHTLKRRKGKQELLAAFRSNS
jgi:hypothetical protein